MIRHQYIPGIGVISLPLDIIPGWFYPKPRPHHQPTPPTPPHPATAKAPAAAPTPAAPEPPAAAGEAAPPAAPPAEEDEVTAVGGRAWQQRGRFEVKQ